MNPRQMKKPQMMRLELSRVGFAEAWPVCGSECLDSGLALLGSSSRMWNHGELLEVRIKVPPPTFPRSSRAYIAAQSATSTIFPPIFNWNIEKTPGQLAAAPLAGISGTRPILYDGAALVQVSPGEPWRECELASVQQNRIANIVFALWLNGPNSEPRICSGFPSKNVCF